jgi:hypothetical protein
MTKSPPRLERPPDLAGLGSFGVQSGVAQNFECAFWLPPSETAKIWILVRPRSGGEGPVILDWKFTCELEVGTDAFSAEEIFHFGYMPWDWGAGEQDTLVGEATRLTVRHGDAEDSPILRARFLITSSALLRSADFITEKNGEPVSARVVRPGPVCRAAGLTFRFSSAYRQGSTGKLESNVECELIEVAAMDHPKEVLSSLEDILTLASLAERRVLILTGWHVEYANGARVSSYRRDFPAPSDEETDIDETLIALDGIEGFLNSSLEKLGELTHPGALKQAIHFALHGQGRGIGDSFAMLFAGVETLLNLFVSDDDLEPIIAKKQWEPLFDRMAAAVAEEEGFKILNEDVRNQLLVNVHGANRAYLADRFRRMCSSQNIDLADLWPMVGGQGSLYAVRNRIVHGRVFSTDQEWFRVIAAKFHLLWTLERSILCILKWPIERSRVSAQRLRGHTLYSVWRTDRDYFVGSK